MWLALCAGRRGIGPLTRAQSPHLRIAAVCEVPGYDPNAHFDRRDQDELDRFAQFAVVAAREAAYGAGLPDGSLDEELMSVTTGCALGGKETEDAGFWRLYGEQKSRLSPFSVPRVMASAAASRIAREFGVRGACSNFSSACAASAQAVALGYMRVASGQADVAIVGGSEAPLTVGHLMSWDALRIMSPDGCRPFSHDRNGMTLGEGGAFLVLEERSRAEARGVRPLAEMLGAGESSDAGHLTSPDVVGATAAIRRALAAGRVAPERVGYVNAHGTGTLVNDAVEARALHAALGRSISDVRVGSTKGAHGHLLGAGGALEAVITVLAIARGCIPPNVGTTKVAPDCDLGIPLTAEARSIDVALSNSFAFGGLNAVLAFQRC